MGRKPVGDFAGCKLDIVKIVRFGLKLVHKLLTTCTIVFRRVLCYSKQKFILYDEIFLKQQTK